MKHVHLSAPCTPEQLLDTIGDNDFVNAGVRFSVKRGRPIFHLTQKRGKIRVKCEIVDRPTRDNGFLVGTYFTGRVTEKDGMTHLSGWIFTEPVFHLIWFALFAVSLFFCLANGAFTVIPFCLSAFVVFMFWEEYKKQGLIERYLFRAAGRSDSHRHKGN